VLRCFSSSRVLPVYSRIRRLTNRTSPSVALDERKALAVKGVHQVVQLGDVVAVVADYVGRKAGSDGVRHPLGRWTQWKHGDSRCRQETRGSLPPTGSRGSQRRRCDRSDDAVGTQDRGDIPPALPRPRRDGAALLHRARAAGCVRGVVWLAGAGSGPGHCRGGHGATAREGDSSQPLPRWRLRPAARA